MNMLQELEQLGQSVWYDNISRAIIRRGELQRMVDEGLLGLTSNPTIFDKAISGSAEYDDQIRKLVGADPGIDAAGLIQALMVEDIRDAADVFRPVYDRTRGRDGYVSIEVTPSKARDTDGTIAEVQELWSRVGRPNAMIKIPATREGLPAIAQAIRAGININVTLIFSEARYREVADVYQTGLEQRLSDGKPPGHVASVASVFVSRIDTLVDAQLEMVIAGQRDPGETARLRGLLGKAAVANTQMIYQAFKEIFRSPRFAVLEAAGAVPQRPLWGSTGTKNPAYHDLLYVDSLIGPHTVNTVPPQTYIAIIDHGRAELTIERNLVEARRLLELLPGAGINMARVLQTLEEEGVAAFEKSFDGLYRNLAAKRTMDGTTS
jgi:transaldolase